MQTALATPIVVGAKRLAIDPRVMCDGADSLYTAQGMGFAARRATS